MISRSCGFARTKISLQTASRTSGETGMTFCGFAKLRPEVPARMCWLARWSRIVCSSRSTKILANSFSDAAQKHRMESFCFESRNPRQQPWPKEWSMCSPRARIGPVTSVLWTISRSVCGGLHQRSESEEGNNFSTLYRKCMCSQPELSNLHWIQHHEPVTLSLSGRESRQ